MVVEVAAVVAYVGVVVVVGVVAAAGLVLLLLLSIVSFFLLALQSSLCVLQCAFWHIELQYVGAREHAPQRMIGSFVLVLCKFCPIYN